MNYFKPLAVLAFVSSCAPAMAQSLCAPHDQAMSAIEGQLGQVEQFWAMAQNGSIVQTFADADGNWTAIVTRPDGISCVVAGGYSYTITPQGESL